VTARAELELRRDDGGVAYVEFLIAFIPFFIMVLGMIQLALYFSANLLVRHAASTAVRAAIVVLPDDPEYYDDEEVNRIEESGGGASATTSIGGMTLPTSSSGSRLDSIRNAASVPLLAISPSYDQLVDDKSVVAALGDPESRFLTGATIYNRTAVAVTFPEEPGSTEYRDSFETRGKVTARVTYLFHCGIPVVSRIFCDDYVSLRTRVPMAAAEDLVTALRSGDPDLIRAAQERYDHASERLENERAGMDELDEAAVPSAGVVYSAFGARFRIIRADATMTNQGAGFTYE
jgi:Flp pilus assembly protein TadG